MSTILFYLSSYLFLYFSRKRADQRAVQTVQQSAADLLESLERELSLKESGLDLRQSQKMKQYLAKPEEKLTLQHWVDISAFTLLVHRCKSITFAEKISTAIAHYHYLIIGGVIFLLLTRNVMFEFLFAVLVVCFSVMLFLAAVYEKFKTIKRIAPILEKEKIPSHITYSIYYYHTFKMLQAPGAAIQWTLDLFRPDTSSQSVNESQK